MTDWNCVNCQSDENLQEHHISYEPEMTITLCLKCHSKVHSGNGVGHARGTDPSDIYSKKEKKLAILLSKVFSYNDVANTIGCSRTTVHRWLNNSPETYFLEPGQNRFYEEELVLGFDEYTIDEIKNLGELEESEIPINLE